MLSSVSIFRYFPKFISLGFGLLDDLSTSLDRAKILEATLLFNMTHFRLLVHQLLNIKVDYQIWTNILQEVEATQS